MKAPLVLVFFLALTLTNLLARGGGGGGHGGEGGMREGGEDGGRVEDPGDRPREDGEPRPDGERPDGPVDGGRVDVGGAAGVRVVNGRNYDATVVGPDGFRAGYVWRDGGYAAVNCEPGAAYIAPYGDFAGWSVMTQPAFVNYPVYATYPVETAVQVALQNLGLYSDPIDGLATSSAAAIEQYQTNNNLPVTGTITPDLLTALGIQATFE
jgi:hypothetical protein